MFHRFPPDYFLHRLARPGSSAGDVRISSIPTVLVRIGIIFSLAPAVLGLVWLAGETDWSQLAAARSVLMLVAIPAVVLSQLKSLPFHQYQTVEPSMADPSLARGWIVAGVFILGPGALWIAVGLILLDLTTGWIAAQDPASRRRVLSLAAPRLAAETLPFTLALPLYQRWGGELPIANLRVRPLLVAVAAVAVAFLTRTALSTAYLAYHAWTQARREQASALDLKRAAGYAPLAFAHLADPFGVLAAALYVEGGVASFLFFGAGWLLVAVLLRRLTRSAERSRQRSVAFGKLERLSRAVLDASPGPDRLPTLLREYVAGMFPTERMAVWRFPDQFFYKDPDSWDPGFESIWTWLCNEANGHGIAPGEAFPWNGSRDRHRPILVAPIRGPNDTQPIGGVYLELSNDLPWDRQAVQNLVPAAEALGSLIGSALGQADAFDSQLQFERVSHELQLAGEIQSGLIPFDIPRIPGWQLAVTLDPAGETSGDFFDIIPLPDGRIGLVIADVVDRGIGAALYMILSRTLLRTYAVEADSDPALVFFATNRRMIADTTSNLFVTAFYGVLDPNTGKLAYSNAGHNPPYVLRPGEKVIIQELIRTGLPIGVQAGATWSKAAVQIEPGDRLILYTDGVPEARNPDGKTLSVQPMLEVAKQNLGLSAEELQSKLLAEISAFVAGGTQTDDITLMVLARDLPG